MSEDQKENQKEFLELINGSRNLIYKIAGMYFKRLEEREDFVQDVSFNAWKSYPKFRHESKFSTWLYKIALNTAYSHLRKRDDSVEVRLINEHYYIGGTQNSNENLDKLHLAAEKLDAHEKALLSLYLDDLSYDEISEVLGISVNLVGVRINRLKNKLKTLITDN